MRRHIRPPCWLWLIGVASLFTTSPAYPWGSKGHEIIAAMPDAPRNEKRTALRFVAHLVGDIHQPLHAGFAQDRGGNSVAVRFNGRKENLHSLWDTGLVELEEGTPAEVAARIEKAITEDERQQWQHGTPAEWALESLAIVRAQVYRLPASGEITGSYTERARAVIRTGLAQSGARLASLLKETLS
jgi:hypothetical protein